MLLLLILPILASISVNALPQGPTITYNYTENITPKEAAQITTAGGSFTTLFINATTQTPRWKAYVGNVTGKLVLDDAVSSSIFDWTLTSVTGEVYATRNTSIDWYSIVCADPSSMGIEEGLLNMTTTNADSINNTFKNSIHKKFYVGTRYIANSTCPAIATYVNDTAQTISENASFQEIMLKDAQSRVVYATLINQNTTGFNNQKYDFQMIIPENEFQASPSTYYLYVELI
jgi:hypothetical protein